MKLFVFMACLGVATAAAPTLDGALVSIHKKRAEYFELSLLQWQISARLQELSAQVQQEAKAVGCEVGSKLELKCKTEK